MSYEELQSKLSEQGFRTSKVINVGMKEDRTIAIHIDCSPLQRFKKEPKIKEICGSEFAVHYIGNGNDYFFISKSNSIRTKTMSHDTTT